MEDEGSTLPSPHGREQGFRDLICTPAVWGDSLNLYQLHQERPRPHCWLKRRTCSGGWWLGKLLHSLWMKGQSCVLLVGQVQAKTEHALVWGCLRVYLREPPRISVRSQLNKAGGETDGRLIRNQSEDNHIPLSQEQQMTDRRVEVSLWQHPLRDSHLGTLAKSADPLPVPPRTVPVE